jgi:hypothetical protein
MEEEGRGSSWLVTGEWEVPSGREEATRGPTEDPWGPVRSGGLLQTAERRLGSVPTSDVIFNFNSDRKTQTWKILYACNDDKLLNVCVHIEENTRTFNLLINKIITCNVHFGEKFVEKCKINFYWCVCFYISFILLQVLSEDTTYCNL